MREKPTILVVDDEPKNVKLLEAQLATKGYEVATAANGEEALQRVSERSIDVILLDVMMPGLDGFEVTRRLRASAQTRLIPIVLVTALGETEDRIKGIEAGCDDFISKPFSINEVLARVKTLLTLSYYRSLLDEKEKFEYVIDHINDGIVVCDQALRVTRLNPRATDLLSLESRNLATNPIELLPHLSQRFSLHASGDVGDALKSQPLAFDLERPETPTTKPLILAIRSSVIRDPQGATSSIVLTVRDVTTERREDVMKQDFLSLISHKLRTPLAVITSDADLLKERLMGALSPQQQELVDSIIEQSHKLEGLIRKLLTFTSLRGEAAVTPPREPIVLQRHLPALLNPILKRAAHKPMALSIVCPDPNATTRIDPTNFDVIIESLVDNAIKFNDKATCHLTLTVTKNTGTVDIAIADNGPGIPPEELGKIFETFYQVEKYFTGNVEGVGLGLALVKRLVSAYGGTIQVQSQLGQGTTFTVTLPQ